MLVDCFGAAPGPLHLPWPSEGDPVWWTPRHLGAEPPGKVGSTKPGQLWSAKADSSAMSVMRTPAPGLSVPLRDGRGKRREDTELALT